MTTRKRIVEKYIEGFRRSDHDQILSCLTDDVVWELRGYTTINGKDAFDAEIENEGFEGSPTLTIERLIEEGDSVVAVGGGAIARKDGPGWSSSSANVFTFSGNAISRLDTYHVNLS